MLRARRQQLHGPIAQVLEKRFPEVIASTPEVIAQQFEGAGRTEQAIRYWQQAGDRDLRRFAMKEAVSHHSNALRLATAMPEGQARNELEVGIWLALGLTQLIAIGPSSDVAREHYRQALSLSSALPGRGRERFLATWGLWFNATISARWTEASELADELLEIARELDNSDFLLEAYHAKVPMMMRVPDFAGMTETAHEVFRLYSRDRHRDHAYYFGGHDFRMCARSFYAQAQWGLGLLDQAQASVRESIEDARDLGHLFTLGHALQRGGHTSFCCAMRSTAARLPTSFIRSPSATNFRGSSATRNSCAAGLPGSMGITKPVSSRCSTPPMPNSPPGRFYRSSSPRLPTFSCAGTPDRPWPRSIAPST